MGVNDSQRVAEICCIAKCWYKGTGHGVWEIRDTLFGDTHRVRIARVEGWLYYFTYEKFALAHTALGRSIQSQNSGHNSLLGITIPRGIILGDLSCAVDELRNSRTILPMDLKMIAK